MNAEILKRLGSCADDSRMLQTAIREYIATLGIDPTGEYVSVLEYLYTVKRHPSADDIFLALDGHLPELTRTKVHTILEILSKLGAVKVIQIDKYNTLYDGDTTPHGHFICSKCGEVLNVAISGNISSVIDLPAGAALEEVQLLCIGECRNCRDRNIN
ncbi:MAG: transcriptional repressor [Rikenellaceae bacterium]|nr:transcriptional repressor [Rikenellaceae bacterium]